MDDLMGLMMMMVGGVGYICEGEEKVFLVVLEKKYLKKRRKKTVKS